MVTGTKTFRYKQSSLTEYDGVSLSPGCQQVDLWKSRKLQWKLVLFFFTTAISSYFDNLFDFIKSLILWISITFNMKPFYTSVRNRWVVCTHTNAKKPQIFCIFTTLILPWENQHRFKKMAALLCTFFGISWRAPALPSPRISLCQDWLWGKAAICWGKSTAPPTAGYCYFILFYFLARSLCSDPCWC